MKDLATRTASTACALAALCCFSFGLGAQAQTEQPHSLALPMPAPAAAPSPAPQQDPTHARSAHHAAKLDQAMLSETAAEAGNSPLQGAGPPQGNHPEAAAPQGSGLSMLSPLQGAGPMDARAMLLGSAVAPLK